MLIKATSKQIHQYVKYTPNVPNVLNAPYG